MTTDVSPIRLQIVPLIIITVAVTAAVIAVGCLMVQDGGARVDVAIGGGLMGVLSLLSLPILQAGFRRGAQAASMAFLAASGGRMILAMFIGLIAVVGFERQPRPTLLAIVGAYLPLLAAEVYFVYRAVADALPSAARQSTEPSL